VKRLPEIASSKNLATFMCMENKGDVVLFDGVCNLCSKSVQFIIKRDKAKLFRFASLQSGFGQKILQQHGMSDINFNSFILLQNGTLYTKSTGALKVAAQLNGLKWSKIFFAVPAFIRDGVYGIIARNRYKWFGKKEACWLPTPALKYRFLD
jgi:predicted DCC family thiol-disulfide oxidoreductase YuxK